MCRVRSLALARSHTHALLLIQSDENGLNAVVHESIIYYYYYYYYWATERCHRIFSLFFFFFNSVSVFSIPKVLRLASSANNERKYYATRCSFTLYTFRSHHFVRCRFCHSQPHAADIAYFTHFTNKSFSIKYNKRFKWRTIADIVVVVEFFVFAASADEEVKNWKKNNSS